MITEQFKYFTLFNESFIRVVFDVNLFLISGILGSAERREPSPHHLRPPDLQQRSQVSLIQNPTTYYTIISLCSARQAPWRVNDHVVGLIETFYGVCFI